MITDYKLTLSVLLLAGLLLSPLNGFTAVAKELSPPATASQKPGLPLLELGTPSPPSEAKSMPLDLPETLQRVKLEGEEDTPRLTRDLGVLWQAAVERNATIRFAIEKLSRKDATGKAAVDPWTKKLLNSLINLGGVAGSVLTQSPVGVLGSGVVQEAMNEGPVDPSRLPVSDADMVVLAKAVDSLQTQLLDTYLSYKRHQRLLQLSLKAKQNMYQFLPQGDDTLLEVVEQDVLRHQQAYASTKTSLALLTGPEAVEAIEQP